MKIIDKRNQVDLTYVYRIFHLNELYTHTHTHTHSIQHLKEPSSNMTMNSVTMEAARDRGRLN